MADNTMTETPLIYINGKGYDITKLTLGEVEDIEEMFDASLADLDWTRAKVRKQIALALLRRDNPGITEDQVRAFRYSDTLTEQAARNGDDPD